MVDVRGAARSGSNELRLVLHPAVEYARQQHSEYPYEIPTNRAPGERESRGGAVLCCGSYQR